MKQLRIGLWVAVAVAGLWLGLRYMTLQPVPPVSSGPGGDFVLTSHQNTAFNSEDYRGRYLLIYFGYSFCPDICPLELLKLSTALYTLEDAGYDTSRLQPVFISVDPERDTPQQLAGMVSLYHPRLVGLTGSSERIAAVADDFNVYYKKVYDETLGTYLMDHFSGIFIIGPAGDFQGLFTSQDTPQSIAESLSAVLPVPRPASRQDADTPEAADRAR